MVRCWKHSEHHLDQAQSTDGDPVGPPKFCFPHKAFWPSITAVLLLFILVFGLTGYFRTSQPSIQVVRFSSQDQTGIVVNQSAIVDRQNNIVTFYLASPANQRSTVLFDIRQGLICYKPVNQNTCLLQKMEQSDYDNIHSFLHEPKQKRRNGYHGLFKPLKHNSGFSSLLSEAITSAQYHLIVNETLRQTEFLSVIGSSLVDMSTLEEPLPQLCQDRTVHWTQKADGPGKQRLVYFCIDICFPSNICVSVCFYYLPE